MKIREKDIESAMIYCNSRIILETNHLNHVIKNRHNLPLHSESFSGQNIVISQINQVRKLKTLLAGVRSLENYYLKTI